MLDSTVVRAHQHAAGAKKHGPQSLGRSRGGFSIKIHALVDTLGSPIGFMLTGGEHADITQAPVLLAQARGWTTVIADKGYDADALVEHIQSQSALAIIPPRSNHNTSRDYDQYRYKERNLVERFFGQLKQFRRRHTL